MADWHCILNSEIDGKALYYESPIISDYAEHLHLGGLYNSLYPYDWLKITGSRSFRCEIKGLARESRVSIFLHSPDAPAKVIKQVESCPTDKALEITLSSFNPEPGQRLTCQIESAAPIDLSSVSWTANTNNDHKVRARYRYLHLQQRG